MPIRSTTEIEPSDVEAARRFLLEGLAEFPAARPARPARGEAKGFVTVSHGIARARNRSGRAGASTSDA